MISLIFSYRERDKIRLLGFTTLHDSRRYAIPPYLIYISYLIYLILSYRSLLFFITPLSRGSSCLGRSLRLGTALPLRSPCSGKWPFGPVSPARYRIAVPAVSASPSRRVHTPHPVPVRLCVWAPGASGCHFPLWWTSPTSLLSAFHI